MSTLYVANATKHYQEIVYRLPETPGARRQTLRPGGQVGIRDLSTLDVEAIIRQNVPYGWTDVSAVDRVKPFVGIVYSADKPVKADKIEGVMEHNLGVLVNRGRQNREMAAVATNDMLERQFEATNIADLKSMVMTIEEEDTKTHSAELSEHFTVDRHAEAARTESQRPKRAAHGGGRK